MRNAGVTADPLAKVTARDVLRAFSDLGLPICDTDGLIAHRFLLVYDMGAGISQATSIHARTVPHEGDTFDLWLTRDQQGNCLGGSDWNKALADIVTDKARTRYLIEDPRGTPRGEAFLLDGCEKAKRSLSDARSVRVWADRDGHEVEVTRSEFEERARFLLESAEALLDKALDEAYRELGVREYGIYRDEFREKVEIVLAGGPTRMPMVRAMVGAKMQRPPLLDRNPGLLVELGAAHPRCEFADVPIAMLTP